MWLTDRVVDHLRDVASWPELPGDRYRIVRSLGAGGMGRVYAARDERLHRDVAIKISNAPAPDAALDARLHREALALADLEHPGIVPVHDAGALADGRVFYVMKLVKGETLERHVARLETTAARLTIFERVVDAMAFAHARGIVHRDLKPSNVMIGSFGEVLVLDWGTAKILSLAEADVDGRDLNRQSSPLRGAGPHAQTLTGLRLGTPGFMAPEQADGRTDQISRATDVFALGALLAWLLEYDGRAVPRRLQAIADKCRAAAPIGRYADAADLSSDLARYQAGQAVLAYPETMWSKLGRWFGTYRTFILLILAYLAMRAIIAWLR